METYWVLRDGGLECRVAANVIAQTHATKVGVTANTNSRSNPQPARRQPGAGLSGLKLTRRGRGFLTASVLAVTIPFASAGAVAAASAPPPAASLQPYTVAPGESLWTIAERVKVPGVDTRDEVSRIKRLNHLHTSNIYAGQVILVDSLS